MEETLVITILDMLVFVRSGPTILSTLVITSVAEAARHISQGHIATIRFHALVLLEIQCLLLASLSFVNSSGFVRYETERR
jgi:hypothetical protein